MAVNYKHLNIEDRDKLAILRAQGKSIREIAQKLRRSHSTLSRELRRNAPPIRTCYYLPHKAQDRADLRRAESSRHERLKIWQIRAYVARQIKRGWSPELISGRVKRFGWTKSISHEAIYQWLYDYKREFILYLPRAHRKRLKRGYSRKHSKPHIPMRVPITLRPILVQNRKQPGHWEADTIVSRRSKPALQIAAERKARYTIINKIPNRESSSMRKTLNKALCKFPAKLRRTITYDNGSENVEHMKVNEVLGTKSYFCRPYTSQEKGTVENMAGLVRRHFPKGTDFNKLSNSKIKAVQRWINNRPMKILNYQTPSEIFRLSGALQS